jgi:hypothetical protein
MYGFSLPAPPKIGDMNDEVILNAGQSTAIEVPFTGNPQPEVKWTFNGGKFTDARRIKTETIFNMTSMTMAKAQRGDAGKYQVALSNEHGQGTVTIKINVIGESYGERGVLMLFLQDG